MDGLRYGTPAPASVDPAALAELDALAFPARLRYGAEGYRARLAKPGAWIATASAGGELAAFCLAAPDEEDPRALFLDVLATRPAWRRRGVAARLVAMCAAHARARGLDAVALTCEPRSADGDDLVAIYRRMGFALAGEAPGYATMRLSLAP